MFPPPIWGAYMEIHDPVACGWPLDGGEVHLLKKSNKMSKFSEGKGAIIWDSVDLALGTLAQQDVISTASLAIKAANERGFRVLKTEYLLLIEGLTAGEGPVIYGLAGPAMSAAQIEETIEARPTGPSDVAPFEQSMRPVWMLGQELIISGHVLAQQQKEIINLGWSFPEGRNMPIWAMNNSNSAALTTGASLTGIMKHFGVWLND